MEWVPTPEDELVTARRLKVDGSWEDCKVQDIRKGDVFRLVAPDGDYIHPGDLDSDEECVSIAADDARKMDPHGSDGQWFGYGVPITCYPSMDELKRKGMT